MCGERLYYIPKKISRELSLLCLEKKKKSDQLSHTTATLNDCFFFLTVSSSLVEGEEDNIKVCDLDRRKKFICAITVENDVQ